MIERKEQLYEGKAKKVFATNDTDVVIVEYKDDATAFNGEKKGTIVSKGAINNRMTNHMMRMFETQGIPTHFIEEISDTATVVKKVKIIPLEVIVRNISAGSFAKRYGVSEGIPFKGPTFEFSLKNDELGDPLINDSHAIALGVATFEEIGVLRHYALKVNDIMKKYFAERSITLVDFKLEFGWTSDGKIVLADEISPDTCRFWEAGTWDTTKHTSFDKDRFRRDLGNVEEGYKEMMKRLGL